jgi:hypothetical protein
MIKRISPNSPLSIPIKEVKQKQLKPHQVIDPTLSSEEKAILQQKMHKETFVEQALKRVEKEIKFNINQESDPNSNPTPEEELTDEQISKFLQEEEIRRGTKIFDPTAFGKAVEKTIPGLRPKK